MNAEQIRRLLDEKELNLQIAQTESNPFMPGDNSDMNHHYCTLSGPDIDAFEFYASVTPDIEPNEVDLIEVLLRDVKVYRGCSGYGDFLAVFELNDDEGRADVEVAWSELMRLAPLIDQILNLSPDIEVGKAPAPSMGA